VTGLDIDRRVLAEGAAVDTPVVGHHVADSGPFIPEDQPAALASLIRTFAF
jgi:hypothetical protein